MAAGIPAARLDYHCMGIVGAAFVVRLIEQHAAGSLATLEWEEIALPRHTEEWEAFLGHEDDLYAFPDAAHLAAFVRTVDEHDLETVARGPAHERRRSPELTRCASASGQRP